MSTIKQILAKKDPAIWSIAPEETVFEAIQLMADKRIGALLVMANGHMEGIISERDYAREVILKGRSSRQTPVRDIMSSQVISAPSTERVQNALSLMSDNRIRHLPIVEHGQVLGIVSMGDLVKEIIDEQQAVIEQLENYIKG